MVLAAGLGSRYGGIKQIAPIGPNGEILIHYAIYDAVLAGFEKIVFVIKREIEADFKAAIGTFAEARAEVVYVFQDEAYLPTGYTLPRNFPVCLPFPFRCRLLFQQRNSLLYQTRFHCRPGFLLLSLP